MHERDGAGRGGDGAGHEGSERKCVCGGLGREHDDSRAQAGARVEATISGFSAMPVFELDQLKGDQFKSR